VNYIFSMIVFISAWAGWSS